MSANWVLPKVGSLVRQAKAVLAADDHGRSARYFGKVMGEYWRHGGQRSFVSMVRNVTNNFDGLLEQCYRYDMEMLAEMLAAGGLLLASIGAL